METYDAISLDLCEDLLVELSDLILDDPSEFIQYDLRLSTYYYNRIGGNFRQLEAELVAILDTDLLPSLQTYSLVDTWATELFVRVDTGVANKYRDILHFALLQFEESAAYSILAKRLGMEEEDVFDLVDSKKIKDWLSIWLVAEYPNIALLFFGEKEVKVLQSIHKDKLSEAFLYLPLFILWNLKKCLSTEFNKLIISQLAMGVNIRKIAIFPLPFTKRMAHLFYNAPKEFTFSQAVWYGYVYGMDAGEFLWVQLPKYFVNWKLDIDYLKMLVLFFRKYEEELEREEFTRLMGYIRHLKDEEGQVSLKGWTLKSLTRRADQWYEALELERQAEIRRRNLRSVHLENLEESWIGAPYNPFLLEKKEGIYSISQLTTLKELQKEGKALKHCVGSYGYRCQIGGSSIWSLRLRNDDETRRLVTIEVTLDKRIVQARTKYNAIPQKEHMQMILQWARAEKLKLG